MMINFSQKKKNSNIDTFCISPACVYWTQAGLSLTPNTSPAYCHLCRIPLFSFTASHPNSMTLLASGQCWDLEIIQSSEGCNETQFPMWRYTEDFFCYFYFFVNIFMIITTNYKLFDGVCYSKGTFLYVRWVISIRSSAVKNLCHVFHILLTDMRHFRD